MEAPPLGVLATAALLVVFLASLVNRWRFRAKYDLHLIPGPPAYPVVGNLPQIVSWTRPQVHFKVLGWMKEYGKAVKATLPGLGARHHIYVSDPEYIQNNVSGHGVHGLPKTPSYNLLTKLISPTNEVTIFTTLEMNEYWKTIRKGMAKAFSTKALKDAFPKLSSKAFELVEVIKNTSSTEPIEIQGLLQRLTFDAIGVVGYNMDFKALQTERHPFLEALEYCTDDLAASALNPFRRLWKTVFPASKLAQDCNKMYAQLYGYYDWIGRELRGRKEPAADDLSIWASLMRIKDPRTGGPLNDATLTKEAGAFIVAGTDTTSHQLMWSLFAIATHPSVQQNIVDELKTSGVFQQIRAGGTDQVFFSDVMGLEYLGMVVKETTRLLPVSPLGSTRTTPEDGMRIHGYRVPKGTNVNINPLILNNAPWVWDKPEVFNPERWCKDEPHGESAADTELEQKSGPRRYWTFSDGPRDCLGQRLALVQLHLVLAVLLTNFQVRLAERMGGWEGVLSRQYVGLVASIDGGMWLHCDPRPAFEK